MADGNENATKKLIRETATRLFREKSFEEVTLGDICRASGINKHTFYYYFKSKDELLEYYYSFPWNLSAAEVTKLLNSENYVEQLWLIIQKYTSFVQTTGVQIIKQILIKNLSEDIGTFRISPEMREIFKLEISIIQKGQEAGQFKNRSDAKVLIILLQQILYSLGLMWTIFQGTFDFNSHSRFMIESLLEVDAPYRTTTEEDIRNFNDYFHQRSPKEDKPKEKHKE